MKEYLEIKFTNQFKDNMSIRVDDLSDEIDGEMIKANVNELANLGIFQGKNGVLNMAEMARIVEITYNDIKL